LLLHPQRHRVVDGGDARNRCAQLTLASGLDHLLRQHVADGFRPWLVNDGVYAGERVERTIHRSSEKLRRVNRLAVLQPLFDGCRQRVGVCRFCIGLREDVFVDEALPGQRADQIERAHVSRRVAGFGADI